MNPEPEGVYAASLGDIVRKRVAKNTVWLLLGRFGSQALLLVVTIFIARKLGDVGLGWYAFITSVVYLGNLTSTFGTDMLIMREVSAKRDFAIVPASLFLQLGLSVPFILLVAFFAPRLPNQTVESSQALFIYSLSLFPMAVYSVFSASLRAVERMDSFTWLNLLNGAFLVSLAWFFVRPGITLPGLAWLLFAAQAVSAGAAAWLALAQVPKLKSVWTQGRTVMSRLVRLAAPIAILAILGVLYQRVAIYLLITLEGPSITGQFSAALRLVEAAKFGHFALLGALFPVMSKFNFVAGAGEQKLLSDSFKLLLLIALGFAALLFFAAEPLTQLVYGPAFFDVISVLRILAVILIPVTITHYFSLMLLSVSKERSISVAISVSLIFLISWIVFDGRLTSVALGVVIAESVQAMLMYIGWRRYRSVNAIP
jgi:O-antigen/teichoic acid export membrane protein